MFPIDGLLCRHVLRLHLLVSGCCARLRGAIFPLRLFSLLAEDDRTVQNLSRIPDPEFAARARVERYANARQPCQSAAPRRPPRNIVSVAVPLADLMPTARGSSRSLARFRRLPL